jgi:hypothetical protein
MKKRYEDWLKLTGKANPKSPTSNVKGIYRVRDLPGFRELEDRLLIYGPAHGAMPPDLENAINVLSERTFGVLHDETLFTLPAGYDDLPEWSEKRWQIDDAWESHERQFDTAEATDDEAVAILAKLGLDFMDERGQPLRCTKLMCRQAEAAAKGIMGHLPDRAEADLSRFESSLEQAARQFMQDKRSGGKAR